MPGCGAFAGVPIGTLISDHHHSTICFIPLCCHLVLQHSSCFKLACVAPVTLCWGACTSLEHSWEHVFIIYASPCGSFQGLEQTYSKTAGKALSINLDPLNYGSFAEIGAGQEVARWFFR